LALVENNRGSSGLVCLALFKKQEILANTTKKDRIKEKGQ